MTWLLVATAWMLLACALAGVTGRGIRLADASAAPAAWTDEVDTYLQRASAGTGELPPTGPQLRHP